MNFCKQLLQAAVLSAYASASGFIELKRGDVPNELLEKYDFGIISFHTPSDVKSRETEALLDGAKAYFEEKIK